MAEYRSSVLDTNQRPVPGVSVTVFRSDGVLASLSDATGVPIEQPLSTDTLGAFAFSVADGLYNIEFRRGGALVGVEYNVGIGTYSGGGVGEPVEAATIIAALGFTPADAAAVAGKLDATPAAIEDALGFEPLSGAVVEGKVDRFPDAPASFISSGYDDLFSKWRLRFFNEAGNRLFPTRGLGPTNAGCPDYSLPSGGNRLSPWQWAQGMNALYERWVHTQTTRSRTRIAGAWAYFQTQFSETEIISPVYGQNATSGLMDDDAWFANVLRQIHTATGDATALRLLIEYVAGAYQRYRDTRSGNPLVDYGVSTPGGIALKRNLRGIQYSADRGYGDIAANHEIMIGFAAFYISQQATASGLPAALKAAYLQLAKDTWQWAYDHLRFAGTTQAIAGIYCSAINLAPNPTNPFSQQFTDIKPTTQRGNTAFADHGTLAQGCLADALYGLTSDAKYLASMQEIASAYPDPLGFGRRWNGLPCLVNAQDPWTDGFFHGEFTRRLVARFPEATDFTAYKQAILGTAQNIINQSTAGLVSPNWGPPELSQNPSCYTWEQDSMNGYSGNGGGGQASGRQIMPSASSLVVVAAALDCQAVEAKVGAGMGATAIEVVNKYSAAAANGVEATLLNPMKQFGSYRSQWNSLVGNFQEYIEEREIRRMDNGGMTLFGGFTIHDAVYADLDIISYSSVTSYSDFKGKQGITLNDDGQFFLSKLAGRPALNWAGGYSIQHDRNTQRTSFMIADSERFALQGGDVFVNGGLRMGFDIYANANASYSIGTSAFRWNNIFLQNAPNVASDARAKNWRGALTQSELQAARDIAALIGIYKLKHSIDEKGPDARFHIGVIAQEVGAAMQAHGLNPRDYSFYCYDSWDAQEGSPAVEADPENHVIGRPAVPAIEAGDMWSIRYEELYAFIIAAQEQRLRALESA